LQVELTKKAIDSIRKDIAKQNSVFSDKKYLDSLFLPSNIIGRRKQAEQLLKHVESLKQGFVVPQISVYGRSGSGKSTVVKFVCQNIQDVVSFAFVNLRKSKTVFGSANLILSELGSSNLKSAEGLNKAVDLLRVTGELSDGKKITKSDVDKAQEQLQKDRISTIVSSASYHLRVVIGAICANTLLTDNSWNATSAIYAKYSKTMAQDTKPLSYRRIVDLLIELENTGLVISRTLSRGRYGYGTEYKLKLSPEMVGPVVGKEWWENQIKIKENEEKMKELEKSMKELSSSRGRRRFSDPYALFKKYGL